MRINILNSFAAGILLTTTICGVVYFTGDSDAPKASAKTAEQPSTVKISEADMKKQLVSAGYIVQTKAEYDKSLQDAAAPKPASGEQSTTAKAVTKVIVNVSEGMTSIDVGRMLVKAGIIQDAFQFSKDIENKGLMNKLRPGVFVVDSEMSYDQVITTIFK